MAHIESIKKDIQKRKSPKRRTSKPKKTRLERLPVRLSKNAEVVLKTRYLKKNERQEVTERPEDLFGRVSSTLAEIEKNWDTPQDKIEELEIKFYNMMST